MRKVIFLNNRPKPLYPTQFRKKKTISASREEISFLLSSTVVIKIEQNGAIFYFRECERHMKLRQYVAKFIEFYYNFATPSPEFAQIDRLRVVKSLQDMQNFKKFSKLLDSYSCIDFYPGGRLDAIDLNVIGLDSGEDSAFAVRLKHFARFALCKTNAYYYNDFGIFSRKFQNAYEARELAYQSLATFFGVDYLIAPFQYCLLEIDGKTCLFGTLMENAGGINILDLSVQERTERSTPEFQHALINLNVLDYLAGIRDHSIYNFHGILDAQGNLISVKAFDNDEMSSFNSEKMLTFTGTHGESCLIDETGALNRPYLDAELAIRILHLKKKELTRVLCPYVGNKPIFQVWQRVVALQNAICKATQENSKCLLQQSEWSQQTVDEEISGRYGNTYLKKIICQNKKGEPSCHFSQAKHS